MYYIDKIYLAENVNSYSCISFIVVAMNRRDWHEIIGLYKISHPIKHPCSSVCLKRVRNTLNLLRYCCTKQSRKSNILIYSKLLNLTACQPAVKPGFTSCRPPDFSQDMHSCVGLNDSFNPLKICLLRHLASFYPSLASFLCSIKKHQVY